MRMYVFVLGRFMMKYLRSKTIKISAKDSKKGILRERGNAWVANVSDQ